MCEKVYKNKILMCEKVYKNKILTREKVYKIKFLWVEKVCNLQMCHPRVPRPLRKILKAQGPSDHQGPGALKALKIIKVPVTLQGPSHFNGSKKL